MEDGSPSMSRWTTERVQPSQMSQFWKNALNPCIENKDKHNTICFLGKLPLE